MKIPHQDHKKRSINCAVITVSDTRTQENDYSGRLAQDILYRAGHHIIYYQIIKDEPEQIKLLIESLVENKLIKVIIFSGGTGISPRDNTYDILNSILQKTISGFGEIFRFLSYQEIGSRAMASRATAGIYQDKIIFSLPGAKNAVSLAMEKLIIPELNHLVTQINPD